MTEPGEEPKEKPKEQSIEWVDVRVVGERGKSALVETEDARRWFVPARLVKAGRVTQDALDKAPLAGVAWEDYLDLGGITADALALALRKAGIYTLDDLQGKDRRLIRIGVKLIGQAVQEAARRAAEAKPPRRQ